MMLCRHFGILIVYGTLAWGVASVASAANFLVSSTADNGPGTLRQAIIDANALPGPHVIKFDPPAFPDPNGTIIALSTSLPAISRVMDISTIVDGVNSYLPVVLSGTAVQSVAGELKGLKFTAAAAGSRLAGLSLVGFSSPADGIGRGISIEADSVTIVSCKIGVKTDLSAAGNDTGIYVASGQDSKILNCRVSANRVAGIKIQSAASRVQVAACVIGTDGTGTGQKNETGIHIQGSNNQIGVADIRPNYEYGRDINVISGNQLGLAIVRPGATSPAPTGNKILGNAIGTDELGTTAIPNVSTGVLLFGAKDTLIAPLKVTTPQAITYPNIISANGLGVEIDSCERTVLWGNVIGCDKDQLNALGDQAFGVFVFPGSTGTKIGTYDPDTRTKLGNVIAGNRSAEIKAFGVSDVLIFANYIGVQNTERHPKVNFGAGAKPLTSVELTDCVSADFLYNTISGPLNALGCGLSLDALGAGLNWNVLGNRFFDAGGSAVFVQGKRRVQIYMNRFSGNEYGIDLLTRTGDSGGLTLNDGAGDNDTGGNDLTNFPTFAETPDADAATRRTRFKMQILAKPNTEYRIGVYKKGPGAHLQGEYLVGEVLVRTDAGGLGIGNVVANGNFDGIEMTALADWMNNGYPETSEFGDVVKPLPGFVNEPVTEAGSGIILAGNSIMSTFTTDAGKTYQLQGSSDLVNWFPIDQPVLGDGGKQGIMELGALSDHAKRFYRLQTTSP